MRNEISKFIIIVLAFLFSSVQAESVWVLSKQADGIQVYVKDMPNSKIKSFKGVVTVPGRLSTLVAVLEDTKAYPRLFHNCKMAKDLKEISNTESYKYIVTSMPWPVKDRDLVTHSKLIQNKTSKQVLINITSAPKYIGLQVGAFRIQNMKARWILSPTKDKKVNIVYEVSVDPGGNLPKWLVNTMAVDMPFHTLNNIRKLAKNKNYQSIKHNYIID